MTEISFSLHDAQSNRIKFVLHYHLHCSSSRLLYNRPPTLSDLNQFITISVVPGVSWAVLAWGLSSEHECSETSESSTGLASRMASSCTLLPGDAGCWLRAEMSWGLDCLKGPFCPTKCVSSSLLRASPHENVLDCKEEIHLSLTYLIDTYVLSIKPINQISEKNRGGSGFKEAADVCGS